MNNNIYTHLRTLHKGYQIFEKIGSGGMSELFRGRNNYLNRFTNMSLAIKLLKSEFMDCDAALYSIETEYLITQNLKNENIIKIYDFVVSKEHIFLVMENLKGVTVNKINSGIYHKNINDRKRLALEIIKTLAYIHSNFVIHGDLKPSNIFITHKGGVKIIDFGLSGTESRKPSNAAYAISVKYSSPERLRDGKISYKDDVYALGCIIYELLSGLHPFNNLTSLEAMQRSLSPATIDSLDAKLNIMIKKMLSFDHVSRPQTALNILTEISK